MDFLFIQIFFLFLPSWVSKINFFRGWWRMVVNAPKMGNIETLCCCTTSTKMLFPLPTSPLNRFRRLLFPIVNVSCLIHKVCGTRTTLDELRLFNNFWVWKQILKILENQKKKKKIDFCHNLQRNVLKLVLFLNFFHITKIFSFFLKSLDTFLQQLVEGDYAHLQNGKYWNPALMH